MRLNVLAGIRKVADRGGREPDAVRFHVPRPGGGYDPVTWGEVLQRSAALARWLEAEGVGHGDRVSVYATTRVEWAWCVHAIEACRAVFVPVYFSNTAEQVRYVVDHSDAAVLFTEKALLPRLLERPDGYPGVRKVVVWDLDEPMADALDGRVTSLDAALAEGRALLEAEPGWLAARLDAIDETDVAAIIYTSGTTGVPKGVVLTVRNLEATAAAWHEVLEHAFPPVGDRRDILWLPVSHMSGWGILGQGTLFDYETWLASPANLLELLPEVRPTMLLSVPVYWEKLHARALAASDDPAEQHAALRAATGGALRFLLSGGAGLKREIKDFFAAAGLPLIEGYGLTECSPNLTMNRLDDFHPDSVGKPMPGVRIDLADDGEVLAKGDNVFRGYHKDPAATAECFDEGGWFRTGDLGRWLPGGFLQLTGRKKDILVTSGGKNVAPAPVEAALSGRACIEHVVLYGSERKFVTALVTLEEHALRAWSTRQGLAVEGATHGDLVAHPAVQALVQAAVDEVNAGLASYEQVKRFVVHPGHLSVAAGQLTPSLKVRRARVWEDFGPALDALYPPA